MSSSFDLSVDTAWVRRAAVTLEEAGRSLRSVADHESTIQIEPGGLGGTAAADSVANLVNQRCGQTRDAADALTAIAVGVAEKLQVAADQFDRVEAALRGHAR